ESASGPVFGWRVRGPITFGGGRVEPGVAGTRDHLTIRVDDEIELRRVTAADCSELYAAIDRNRSRLHTWLPWATDTFNQSDLLNFIQQREIDNDARVSLTT